MARIYTVRVDDEDDSKFAVWLIENEGSPPVRAIPGVRVDTPYRAELLRAALSDAYAAGYVAGAALAKPEGETL